MSKSTRKTPPSKVSGSPGATTTTENESNAPSLDKASDQSPDAIPTVEEAADVLATALAYFISHLKNWTDDLPLSPYFRDFKAPVIVVTSNDPLGTVAPILTFMFSNSVAEEYSESRPFLGNPHRLETPTPLSVVEDIVRVANEQIDVRSSAAWHALSALSTALITFNSFRN